MQTFPRCLLAHGRERGNRPAFREKRYGIWQQWTWSETEAQVRAIAGGLAALGFGRGMHLALVGDNRPYLYWAMLAAQALGGVPVPLYQDAQAEDMAFILDDAGIRHAIVEDQEQADKLLPFTAIEHLIVGDMRGLRHYQRPGLRSLAELQALNRLDGAAFEARIAQGQPGDPAIILYTSGTTGKPKGVVQSHASLLAAGAGCVAFDRLNEHDQVLSYLPMAWVGDCLFSLAQAMSAGFTVNCPESADTVLNDMREIGPTLFFAPPRVLESLLTMVSIRMEDASRVKRALYRHFIDAAQQAGATRTSLAARLHALLGEWLIYGPLKNQLGMSRLRVAYTAGAAIGPDLFRFYRAIGINLKQLYGSTETCAYVCLQPDGQIKYDSVGPPAPGVSVRLDDNGEVLVRSASLLSGYHRRGGALDGEGWFHTGDAGLFDADGHLKIIDRAADVGRLRNGALFAPNYIENKLKFYPFIKEAVAFGDQRDTVCAFINIDLEAAGHWAERHGVAWSGYADLAAQPAIYAQVAACVAQANASLAREPGMAPCQVRRFLILHKELDADDEELTRTRKLRRGFIAAKYAVLVDALYAGLHHQKIRTEVRFEDGRRGSIEADLRIIDTEFAQAA